MPLVITTDGKRAGAAEELAAFTRILGIPLLIANHPVGLERAAHSVERFSGIDRYRWG